MGGKLVPYMVCPEVGLEWWARCFAHFSGGVEGRGCFVPSL